MEAPGIDPGTSRMLGERSTIWATPPEIAELLQTVIIFAISYQRSFVDHVHNTKTG